MLYAQLEEAGAKRTSALNALKLARDERLDRKLIKKLAAEATSAVIEYEKLTQPDALLPYVLRLLHDATRYRHFREDATVSEWQQCTAIKGKDLDRIVDELIEANFTKNNPEQPTLPLED